MLEDYTHTIESIVEKNKPALEKNELDLFRKKLSNFFQDKSELDEIKETTRKEVGRWQKEIMGELGIQYDEKAPTRDLMTDEAAKGKKPSKKKNISALSYCLAMGGIAFLAILVILSGVCASTDYCLKKDPNDGKWFVNNIPLEILQSQLMVVFVATIIGPVFAQILREKYNIQIQESQITMIMQDAVNAVKMYSKESGRLRDPKTGKISEDDQRKLRNLAFASLKSSYDQKEYRELIANVGSQVFERAIEKAVEGNKLERLPLEKKQVEEIIKQAIDATPAIIKWQSLDDNVKTVFIDGHVRRLLANIGVEGWTYKMLESVFDSETNKRILAASIAEKNNLLSGDIKDPNLKYTSIALSAAIDSLTQGRQRESTP